jgi:hypothetical protein
MCFLRRWCIPFLAAALARVRRERTREGFTWRRCVQTTFVFPRRGVFGSSSFPSKSVEVDRLMASPASSARSGEIVAARAVVHAAKAAPLLNNPDDFIRSCLSKSSNLKFRSVVSAWLSAANNCN